MEKYDPKRMELSTRALIAKSIFTEITEGRGTEYGAVYLDISHRSKEYLLDRLPAIYKKCLSVGIDMSTGPIEIAPTAHYSMGGIKVNSENHMTSVDNLYAVGECASGVHGANRLGGNSIGEALVCGRIVAGHILKDKNHSHSQPGFDHEKAWDLFVSSLDINVETEQTLDYDKIEQKIKKIMTRHSSIVRDEKGLEQALSELKIVKEEIKLHNLDDIRSYIELLSMYYVSLYAAKGALVRKETRGAHTRLDYPDTKKEWRKNISWSFGNDEPKLIPPGDIPEEILPYLEKSVNFIGGLE